MDGQLTKIGTGEQLRFIRKLPYRPSSLGSADEPRPAGGMVPGGATHIEDKPEEMERRAAEAMSSPAG